MTGVQTCALPILVLVDGNGENQIVVSPGANDKVVFDEALVASADALMLQNEVPHDVLVKAARACKGLVVLNPSPVRELSHDLLDGVNVMVMTRHEYEAYGQIKRGMVVVTDGSNDAVSYNNGVEVARATPPEIEAVDSVGAGDTFAAALVVGLVSGMGPSAVLRIAVKAAALATRQVGAQTAIPTAAEVDEMLRACRA